MNSLCRDHIEVQCKKLYKKRQATANPPDLAEKLQDANDEESIPLSFRDEAFVPFPSAVCPHGHDAQATIFNS